MCAALVGVGACYAKNDNQIFQDNFNNYKKYTKQWTNNLSEFPTATLEYVLISSQSSTTSYVSVGRLFNLLCKTGVVQQ